MWCNVAWVDAAPTDVGHFHSPEENQGPLHQNMVWGSHTVLKTVRAPPKCYHKRSYEQTFQSETGSDGWISLNACTTLCTKWNPLDCLIVRNCVSLQVLMEALIAYTSHVWEDVRAEAKWTTSQLLVFPDLAESNSWEPTALIAVATGGVYLEHCHTNIMFEPHSSHAWLCLCSRASSMLSYHN